jgi:ABC-2 type transport system permease protein
MSTTLANSPAVTAPPLTQRDELRVTQLRVLRSEWTKFRSLRSTMWTLLVAVLLMVGLGALFSGVTANQWDTLDAVTRATFDPTATSLAGVTFAQLAIGVLAILMISGEYATGMIRSSLTAVPRRLPVLWGKAAVFTGVVLVVSLAAGLASFLIGQALLDAEGLGISLTDPNAFRSVIGATLYVTLAGLIAMALGALLRTTAAAISTFVGLFFVFPPLTGLLPASWTDVFVPYLPSSAGSGLYGALTGSFDALSFGASLTLLSVYAVGMISVAAWRLRHTDA